MVVSLFSSNSFATQKSPNVSLKDGQKLNNKINSDLLSQFKDEKNVTYLVKMKEQGNTQKAAEKAVTKAKKNKASLTSQQVKRIRTSAVVSELRSTAIETQQSLENFLTKAKKAGNVASYSSYYIVNAMSVTSDKKTMKEIAAMSDVDKVLPNRTRQLNPELKKASKKQQNKLAKQELADTEWNIDRVGAPQVWEETGIDGNGVVVANIDTGVQGDHPALLEKYRGYDPSNPEDLDHEYNWFDATAGEDAPYDDQGHGTHTMGTMVGDEADGSNQVGVAPGAEWIAVKAFTAAGGTDVDLLAAGEWILSPKDDEGNPHPEMAPDVVNNSWGGGPGLDEWYRPMVQNWREAGIVPVFSAGNDGPADGSIAAPSNYPEAIAVGATTASDGLASFSSRGPSPYDGEVKPDISAPGANIRSSVPGDGYEGGWNGTSMAGPHVAGTAALLLQADSGLSVDDLEEVMLETADTATDDQYPEDPNEGFGHGIVNAYTAVSAVVSGLGEISGHVYKEGEDEEAPTFEHESPEETFEGLDLPLLVDVTDNVSIDSVDLQFRLDNGSWETVSAELVDGDFAEGTYQATIPADAVSGDLLEYKWTITDFGDNEVESDVYEVTVKDAISVGYEQDFETTPTGWFSFGSANSWEWGVPEAGPEEAASGEKVYGTNLEGDHGNDADMTLVMPPVEVPEGNTFLQFNAWHNLESNYDYGHVVVSTDMENWEQLEEYNGETDGWQEKEVNLSDYAGEDIFVGFHVDSDFIVTNEGMYIDDVTLTDQSQSSSIGIHFKNRGQAKKAMKTNSLGKINNSDSRKKPVNPNKLLPGAVKNIKAPGLSNGQVEKGSQPNLLPLDASVTVLESDSTVNTDPSDGSFNLLHAAGDLTLQADAYGYQPSQKDVQLPEDGTVETNFTLDPIPQGEITGTVTNDQTGEPIEGATLMLLEDAAIEPVETGEDGTYAIEAYEGEYTLKVMAPNYHSTEVPVTIEADSTVTVDVQLDPFIGYPGEIGYDDGSAENARAFYDAGNGWAVKMSLEEGKESAMVTGGLFRFWGEDWPVPGGNDFQVEVYDANGPDGAPGNKLGGPYDAEALRNGEWTQVDLSDKGIVATGDFYMVYIQTDPNPNAPGLGTDEDGEYVDRSWQYVDGSWSKTPEAEGNYMIRAMVDYAAEAPVIESPEDGSFTNEGTVTVEGSAAPMTTLTVLNDGEEAASTEVGEDGQFALDVALHDGENELVAVSSADNGSTDPSAPVVVTLDQEDPELSITSPEDGEKINKEVVNVTGQVDEENLDRLIVNGQRTDVDEDGSYSKRILLNQGENEIKVRAIDKADNRTVETVTVDVNFEAPEITNVLPEDDKYLQAGESVKIEFDSAPGLDATFYIKMPLTNATTQATELPMMETEEGHYEGYWTATSNLVAEGAEIFVKAEDDYGNLTEAAAEGKLFINVEE